MRILIQRVSRASCKVDGRVTGEIQKGFLCLVGFTKTDTIEDVHLLSNKTIGLRVFEDENHKMNRALQDIGGSILAISQFTLYADCKHGNRPSFTNALEFNYANELYDAYCRDLEGNNIPVAKGIFGADMKIELLNDGPVTILLDSTELKK